MEDNDQARFTKSPLRKPLPVNGVILAALKYNLPPTPSKKIPFQWRDGNYFTEETFSFPPRRSERRKGNHNKLIVAVGGLVPAAFIVWPEIV